MRNPPPRIWRRRWRRRLLRLLLIITRVLRIIRTIGRCLRIGSCRTRCHAAAPRQTTFFWMLRSA